ncbi:MAG: hypothetical protein K2I88_00295, partial [Anaeroplasmataceae bacterium]|nr:hypothetical protein [Anaeroplasmataceae bacterium]
MKLLKKILNIALVLGCIVFLKRVNFGSNCSYVSIEEPSNLNENNYTASNDKLNIENKQEPVVKTVDKYNLNALKSVQTKDSCKQYCLSCGPGREVGYSSSYVSTGCRNWEGYAYGNYGSANIPYWINMNTMNSISNGTHRNTLINDIRYQAWLWNQAVMHDGTGQIVNLYEVGTNELSLPSKINNKKVVEI